MTTNLVLDPRQRAMLAEMGVRVWLPSDKAALVAASSAAISVPVRREPPLRLPVLAAPPTAASDAPIHYKIGNLPEGAAAFDVVLLGEPCSGAAEKLLASMARVLGERAFVAQLVPTPHARASESESLAAQLAKFQAKTIVALGPHSAKALLGEAFAATPFGKLRGLVHKVDGLKSSVVMTYHPLQLLRQPLAKAQAWTDLKLTMKAMK